MTISSISRGADHSTIDMHRLLVTLEFDTFVTKPITLKQFLETVGCLLDGGRMAS